jgi:hypothetical protein
MFPPHLLDLRTLRKLLYVSRSLGRHQNCEICALSQPQYTQAALTGSSLSTAAVSPSTPLWSSNS